MRNADGITYKLELSLIKTINHKLEIARKKK